MRFKHLLLYLIVLNSLGVASTQAAVVASIETDVAPTGGDGAYDPVFTAGGPSSTDILEGVLPDATTGNFAQEDSTGPPALTNGTVATMYGTGTAESNHVAYATGGNNGGTSLTYSLSGIYDITSLVVFGGWNDAGRDAQNYEIYTSDDGAQSFDLLTTFDNSPGEEQGVVTTPVSHRVEFTEDTLASLATGITHLRFDFLTVENGYTGYTEIDVIGDQQFLPGDADRNGSVDINDFFLISDNFFTTPSAIGLDGDIVADNFVDAKDFRLWKNNAPAAALAQLKNLRVPEPLSATCLALAVVICCCCWRRF